jgi:hypothetical protein
MGSTALEGWQSDHDNTRSSWDILWSCLSTVIACTWTVLHLSVPQRDVKNSAIILKRITVSSLAILAPEMVAFVAALDFRDAKRTAAKCNEAQAQKDREGEGQEPQLLKRATELSPALVAAKLYPVHTQWSVSQGFCVNMSGLVLQTRDGWLYPIRPETICSLIKEGIVRCSDFRDRDIEDRAKADPFSKFVTVLQSGWVVCNIIARAASRLPITLLELSTAAYVVCAIGSYALWWYKPKDMITPIAIYLPYDRDGPDMPPAVQRMVDGKPADWFHVRGKPDPRGKLTGMRAVRKAILTIFFLDGFADTDETPSAEDDGSQLDELQSDLWGVFISLVFCSIHITAYVGSRYGGS